MSGLIATLVLCASCASTPPDDVVVGDVAPVDDEPVATQQSTSPPTSASTTTAAVAQSTTTASPASADHGELLRLDPLDALIPEGALGGPWEPLWRSETFTPVPWNGQRHTSCLEFDRISSLTELRATAKWALDDAVVNHFILQFDTADEVDGFMRAATQLHALCPTVEWTGEGVTETVSALDLDLSSNWNLAIANFETRQQTVVTLQSVAASGNLISVLTVEQWDADLAEPIDEQEFGRLAQLAVQWLEEARAEPRTKPSTSEQQPDTADDLPEDLVALLLSNEDLSDWDVVRTASVFDTEPRIDESGQCPSLKSMRTLSDWFVVERTMQIADPEWRSFEQLIGTAPTAELGREVVRDLSQIDECPNSVLFGFDVAPEGFSFTTTLLDIVDADVAVGFSLRNETSETAGSIIMLVDDFVVGIGSEQIGGTTTIAQLEQIAERAAGKVSAGRDEG